MMSLEPFTDEQLRELADCASGYAPSLPIEQSKAVQMFVDGYRQLRKAHEAAREDAAAKQRGGFLAPLR